MKNAPRIRRPPTSRMTNEELRAKVEELLHSLANEFGVVLDQSPSFESHGHGKLSWQQMPGQSRIRLAVNFGTPRLSDWINVGCLDTGNKSETEIEAELRRAIQELKKLSDTLDDDA